MTGLMPANERPACTLECRGIGVEVSDPGGSRSVIIFDSPTIRVRAKLLETGTDLVVVTFPARSLDAALTRHGFGEALLEKYQVPALHVTFATNHWLQTPDLTHALRAILEVTSRYGQVVTYGSSMGGYCAAITSKALMADRIISVAPQISIDPAKVPWEPRWVVEARALQFFQDDMAKGIRSEAELTVVYDPQVASDKRHARELLTLSKAGQSLIAPFCGHPPLERLHNMGVLRQIALGLIKGEMSVSHARGLIRANRGTTSAYLKRRAIAIGTRFPVEALSSAQRAIDLDPADAEAWSSAGRVYFQTRQFEEAIPYLLKGIDLQPSEYRHYMFAARALRGARRNGQALALAKEGLHLGGNRNFNQVALVMDLQFSLGRKEECIELYEQLKIINTPEGTLQSWRNRLALE